MGVTDQGAREARYAEAIHHATEQATLGWPQESLRLFVEPILREVLAVADAEVAAAVSEAQAEMRAKWAADVANVQAVALAQRNDAVVYRAEVERLREGIRALADSWDPPVTTALLQQGFGWDKDMSDMADDLRALLTPSPAARLCVTHGGSTWPLAESRCAAGDPWDDGLACSTTPAATAGEAIPEQLWHEWHGDDPAPVSSGEAETGEAACGKDLGDTYVCRCLLDRGHSGMHQCRHFAGPAPVVTPSAEGSE